MAPTDARARGRDAPWIMRTYAGHSTPAATNALFRSNLAKGQTGLSIAFDLPTQTGYDADHELARGEVGRVGVPIGHLGDLRTLLEGIDLEASNTSMTINATAMWLLALFIALAEERGIDPAVLAGTTQNDILKEYLARGTHVFPPGPSMRLQTDVIAHAVRRMPRFNPMNVCSYHLQEAGATPAQEIAFALADAIATLDTVRERGLVASDEVPALVGRTSFFVNAGIRFVEEVAKVRAFALLWDRVALERYGVADPRLRRFRYGVQVNSLGLTEQQPENNIARIAFELLGVTLSRDARARAVQLPAWNEALGLPRPWDQQVSLRIQQVLAHETDLLEVDDLFEGSHVMTAKVDALVEEAGSLLDDVLARGGALEAVDHMKAALVVANAARLRRIESGEQVVVGVNAFATSEPSPLTVGAGRVLRSDPEAEAAQVAALERWRADRDAARASAALDALARAAAGDDDLMGPSIACAHAGVTTGEWAGRLREVLGEYRAPTGLAAAGAPPRGAGTAEARERVTAAARRLGRPLRILVGKPGLDGHSSGAEQVALRARDLGMEVVYDGIRLSPERIVRSAVDEDVSVVGLSLLSGSHLDLVPRVLDGLAAAGLDVPVVVGGIVPDEDAELLRTAGVAAVFTPRDYELDRVLAEVAELAAERAASRGGGAGEETAASRS